VTQIKYLKKMKEEKKIMKRYIFYDLITLRPFELSQVTGTDAL
jgi:hypothetical protein